MLMLGKCSYQVIPSAKTTLYRNFDRNAVSTRDRLRLDGVARERVSSRQCVNQAMDGLVVAKQQYTVCLINIELNQRFSQFKLKNITAHGIFAEYRHRYGAALEMRDVEMDSDMHGGSRSVDGHRSHFFLK